MNKPPETVVEAALEARLLLVTQSKWLFSLQVSLSVGCLAVVCKNLTLVYRCISYFPEFHESCADNGCFISLRTTSSVHFSNS